MGWRSPNWSDDFSKRNTNLANRSGWDDWNTELPINAGVVGGGVAKLINVDPPGGDGGDEDQTVSGAVTSESRVPVLDTSPNERNKWTVVADFYAKTRYKPLWGHIGIFLRVHDRDYRKPGETDTHRDQTRFGCFVRGDETGNTPQAALQFHGDKASDPDYSKRYIRRFDLDEDPFDHPNTKYRIQIIEEEWLSPLTGWTHRWKGEVWKNPGAKNAVRIGHYHSISENVLSDRDIAIPPLSGSKIALGSGPARAGEVHVDFVGNAGWDY